MMEWSFRRVCAASAVIGEPEEESEREDNLEVVPDDFEVGKQKMEVVVAISFLQGLRSPDDCPEMRRRQFSVDGTCTTVPPFACSL